MFTEDALRHMTEHHVKYEALAARTLLKFYKAEGLNCKALACYLAMDACASVLAGLHK